MLIGPGLKAFTRIPRGASSAPSERARDRTAAFVADRIDRPGVPTALRNDVVRTILPPLLRMGAAFWTAKKSALEVDRELLVDLFLGHSFQRCGVADARIREQNVEMFELLPDRRDELVDVGPDT